MLKEGAWLLHLIRGKAPPAARALNRSCYPHTGNGGHSWCLSGSLSLPLEFSIRDEAINVARSALQGAHYHVDVICLLP